VLRRFIPIFFDIPFPISWNILLFFFWGGGLFFPFVNQPNESLMGQLMLAAFGAWISSVSLFILMWQSISGAILFVVVLSVGEAIWSPRLYEYTTIIAPKGREGQFAHIDC
jgi:hypothetical protein